MAKEIERKYLVKGWDYRKDANGILIRQAYICSNPNTVVRVRTYGDKAYITVKGKVSGLSRDEFEYPIPVSDAEEMMERLCTGYMIEKYRYEVEHRGNVWEVDEFFGHNKGLVVAEIELASEAQEFEAPNWILDEITFDFRFAGSSLSQNPYTLW